MDWSITLQQRASFYRQEFPDWPPPFVTADGRWLYGVWLLGNDYRRKAALYGAYPPNYLKRVEALFPDAGRVLHLFSGSLQRPPDARPGWTALDIRRTAIVQPTVQGSAEQLPFADGAFDFVFVDPPYSPEDATRYETAMPNRRKVLRELSRVVQPGGVVVWLDGSHPMYRKREWHFFGFLGLVRSTGHRYRGVAMFRRTEEAYVAEVGGAVRIRTAILGDAHGTRAGTDRRGAQQPRALQHDRRARSRRQPAADGTQRHQPDAGNPRHAVRDEPKHPGARPRKAAPARRRPRR